MEAVAFAATVLWLFGAPRRQLVALVACSLVPAGATLLAAVATGTTGVWTTSILVASSFRDVVRALFVTGAVASIALVWRAARHPEWTPSREARHAPTLAALVVAALAALRLFDVATSVGWPGETGWSEAPFLVDAMKIDSGLPLYGPPERLDSYTYSPLLSLVHHAVLAPAHLELSLPANRALGLVYELAAAAVAWRASTCGSVSGGGSVPWAPALLVLAATSSMLAATVHPDHAVLACIALAFVVVTREGEPRSRSVRVACDGAILLLAPLAASFKLTGAAIGAALGVAYALERRWREVGLAVGSLALVAATFPLFTALERHYTFYAVTVQASQPMAFERLPRILTHPVTALVALTAALLLAVGAGRKLAGQQVFVRAERRVVVVALITGIAAFPAWLKCGGRDNNLLPWTFGAAVLLALRARRAPPSAQPGFAVAATLVALLAVPPATPPDAAMRRAILDRAAFVTDVIRAADARHEQVLAPATTLSWIDAGHRDVPSPRLASAVELFFAHVPAADRFFDEIERGAWETVVVGAEELTAHDSVPARAFTERLRRSLERGYVLAATHESDPRLPPVLVFRRSASR